VKIMDRMDPMDRLQVHAVHEVHDPDDAGLMIAGRGAADMLIGLLTVRR
jgi:hypothetical protein